MSMQSNDAELRRLEKSTEHWLSKYNAIKNLTKHKRTTEEESALAYLENQYINASEALCLFKLKLACKR